MYDHARRDPDRRIHVGAHSDEAMGTDAATKAEDPLNALQMGRKLDDRCAEYGPGQAPFAGGAFTVAAAAQERGWGLLHLVEGPVWLEAAIGILALDFIIYWQHRIFHVVPLFWRFHMMHHSDLDLDVTSGVRFHPMEIVLSLAVKVMAIMVVGASPIAVMIFEVVLNATSLFNHGNVLIPQHVERLLRWMVVTPDMHRIHHSMDVREMNSNYGFNVPWWDRVFGTYCPEPALGHLAMRIGLEHLGPSTCLNIFMMLRFPFSTSLKRYSRQSPI